MGKRVIKCTPVAILVVLVALFLGAEIAAAGLIDPLGINTPCPLLKLNGDSTGYSVTAAPLNGYFPIPGSAFPEVGSGSVWRYTVSSSLGGTQFGGLVPVCAPIDDSVNNINYTGNHYFGITCGSSGSSNCIRDTSMVFYPPATKLSTNWGGWGSWDGNDNIVTLTSIGQTTFAIGTDNDAPIPLRRTSMQFKSGNNLFYCANIAGPGCYARKPPPPPPEYSQYTVNSYREITTAAGVRVCVYADTVTECDIPIYCRDSQPCGSSTTNDAACYPPGYAPEQEMKFITMPEVMISLTPGHEPSSLSNIGLPGANRCGIIVINDANPTGTTCGVNPITKKAYCW